MPSAAGPLLMHARDCFEFSFLFFPPRWPVVCYCLWIRLAMGALCHTGQDTVLENATRVGENRKKKKIAKLVRRE